MLVRHVLQAAAIVPLELIAILIFSLGYLAGARLAGKPLWDKLGACGGALLVAALIGFSTSVTLGTHSENCDPDGGCDEVVDFIPTDTQRERAGLDMFFVTAPPGLLGLVIGAWPQLTGRRSVRATNPD